MQASTSLGGEAPQVERRSPVWPQPALQCSSLLQVAVVAAVAALCGLRESHWQGLSRPSQRSSLLKVAAAEAVLSYFFILKRIKLNITKQNKANQKQNDVTQISKQDNMRSPVATTMSLVFV